MVNKSKRIFRLFWMDCSCYLTKEVMWNFEKYDDTYSTETPFELLKLKFEISWINVTPSKVYIWLGSNSTVLNAVLHFSPGDFVQTWIKATVVWKLECNKNHFWITEDR